jgi:ABC-type nitrate/sulfonate/bicarbonate transport system permease component
MRFNVKALAISTGIFWGVALFWEILAGGVWGIRTLWASPEVAELLASIYPGITFTLGGSLLALIYGFACGVVCGGVFGWLYNWVAEKLS